MYGDPYQHTLAQAFTYSGIALHSGKSVTMRCQPAEVDCGIAFRRTDMKGQPMVKAKAENVISTVRCTSIGNLNDHVVIHGVEHLLAAFAIQGIDNAVVELDEAEPPAGDGSALAFLVYMQQVGKIRQDKPALVKKVDKIISVSETDASLSAVPFEGVRVSYTLSYSDPVIGTQYRDFTLNPRTLLEDIAPARTFGFESELESLQRKGLALGGSLENAVLVTGNGTANPLRFPDEFVRHKILDLIGDLSLNGRVQGHFTGIKSGHKLNVMLSRRWNP